MISVRKEWKQIKSDEDLLAWSKKWGALLMETFQNPIWASGYAEGVKSVHTKLEAMNKGEYDDDMDPVLEEYAKALSLIQKNLKVVQFFLTGSKEVMFNLDEDKLISIAAEEMSKQLVKYIDMQVDDDDPEEIKFYFNLVMVDD